MGAPTSNRKRNGHFSSSKLYSAFSLSSPIDFDLSPGLPSAKRSKPSHDRMSPDPVALNPSTPPPRSRQSTFSRVKQYPPPAPNKREVHAPVWRSRFSSAMGNSLRRFQGKSVWKERELKVAKQEAFDTFRHVKLDEEVVDVDRECSDSKPVVVDDSSDDEDIRVLDSGVKQSQKPVETNEGAYLREKYQSFGDYGGRASSSLVSDLSNQTPKDDDVASAIVSASHEVDLTKPSHKRQHEVAESRNAKLSSLDFQIILNWTKLYKYKPAKSPKQDLLKEAFVELTNEEEAEVSRALSNSSRRKLLVTHPDSNIEITGDLLQCLRPGAWLNDEVINLYLELLKEREKREPQKFLKCHFFNTFFYKKLISGRAGYDFKAVRRWTTQRKIGYALIDCDKIFIPIHKEIHWCLAIINKKDKKFQYLDSLKGKDSRVLQVLAKYYVDEVKDKSAKDIDVSSWEQEYVHDLPAQENGFDCGMFMIKYADFYSRGLGLAFGQKHMPYFRKRTAKEILNLKAE